MISLTIYVTYIVPGLGFLDGKKILQLSCYWGQFVLMIYFDTKYYNTLKIETDGEDFGKL